MARRKTEKELPPIESLPEPLRKTFVKILARYNCSIEEGYEKLATLADQNSRLFDEAVKREAHRLYKSGLMTQMNAARASIYRSAEAKFQAEITQIREESYNQGKIDNAIYYYCKVCQKPMYIKPNSKEHQAVVDAMYKLGWGHNNCHNMNR